MAEGKVWGGKRWLLVGLLVLLIVIVVGLTIGFLIIKRVQNDNEVGGYETSGLVATELEWEIVDKFESDGEYFIDDAKMDYEQAMSVGSNEQRVYVAINYANFVYEYENDIDAAVGILQRAEPLLDGNNNIEVDLYVAFRSLYELAGMEEQADYYNEKISSLLSLDEQLLKELIDRENMNGDKN